MNLTHIHAFTAAMQRKDLEAMLSHMADDVTLNTPLAAEPVKGKAAIRSVVGLPFASPAPIRRWVERYGAEHFRKAHFNPHGPR